MLGPDWADSERVTNFLSVPRTVMEEAAKSQSITLNTVLPTVDVLITHCDQKNCKLDEGDAFKSAAKDMVTKLQSYLPILAQDPAIIAKYLDPGFQSHQTQSNIRK